MVTQSTSMPFYVPNVWFHTTLGALTETDGGLIQTGPFGSQLHASDYVCDGVPSIMPVNIGNGRIVEQDIKRVAESDAHRLSRHRVQNGDIVFSRRGDVERHAFVTDREVGWLCGTGCLLVRIRHPDVLPRFASFWLSHAEIKGWLTAHAVGSTMPNLNTSIMARLPIAFPPIREQRAIVDLLSDLDDKIELNRRTNETLEAMARSLFKSWFVDFDPVTAKAAGKKPFGMTDDLAALFPSGYIDSDQGTIPKGWQYRPVGEVIEAVFDGPHATPPDSDEGAVFLGIKNMTGTGLDLTDIRHISEADWPKWTRRVTPRYGDIVFTYEATLGFFALIPPGLRCCLGRRMALVRPSTEMAYPHFLFHWFVSEPFQETIERGATHGSTVNRVPLLNFPKYSIVWPTMPLVEKFEHRASTIWATIHQRQEESHQLIALRDSLLPKLLSGEIRLRDAERKIKEVV